jgi:hypothetical protein
MFIIKWRTRRRPQSCHIGLFSKWLYRIRWIVQTGLRRYATHEAAAEQVAIFQRHFPANDYYIERA